MKNRLESMTWAATSALLTATVFLATFSSYAIAQAQTASEAAASEETASEGQSQDDDYYALLSVFVDTFEQIDRNYVKDVNRRELVDAAIRGMLAELDPYSNYISPDDVERFNEAITQEFGGVGIRVNFDDEMRALEITSPIPGSPAYRAGIKSGDRLVEIDGIAVRDFPNDHALALERAVELLRGAPGSEVEVGILHPGSEEIEKLKLVREQIQLDTVMGYSYKEDDSWNFFIDDETKIGYIRLTHFNVRSAGEMREALKSLKRDGMKGLILDLRFNPGGQLQAAIDIADLFIEQGEIVRTEGRNSAPRSYPAKRFGTFTGFPMAVLVNRFSASASEIVSACLQDHQRAIVVGERSWGKGSVQNVIPLNEDGNSQLKLTTASYFRPSGKNIHRFPNAKEEDEWGVMPDEGYLVKFDRSQIENYQEDRRLRDVISPQEPYVSKFVDTQLDKAVEYVKEQLAGESKPAPEESTDKPAAGEVSKDAEARLQLPYVRLPRRDVG